MSEAARTSRLLATLGDLASRGVLDPYDVALARLVCELDRRAGRASEPLVGVLAALTSLRTREGDVCLALADVAGQTLFDGALQLPSRDALLHALEAASCVASTGVSGTLPDDAPAAPLVLDAADRLYLRRYWRHERTIADAVSRMACDVPGIDDDRLREAITRWFGPVPAHPDGQRTAAAIAALRRFAVITGGPGTGKTTTVARVLAVLHDLHGPEHRVLLAAPTGKAATRLQSAIHRVRETRGLPFDPPAVQTVHRMLGPVPGSIRFRHDERNPLPADCVVVDEASMIDLALAARLVRALAPGTRLILLGDRDQLASVEAGAVFHSVCDGPPGLSPSMARRVAAATGILESAVAARHPDAAHPEDGAARRPLADCVARLEFSHRFDAAGGIGALAAAIRAGDADAARAALEDNAAVHRLAASPEAIVTAMEAGHAAFVEAVREGAPPVAVLDAADRFRALAATRSGPVGTLALNAAFERVIKRGVGAPDRDTWYAGRLVIITANDYGARLFNGDVGVTLPDPARGGALRVFFAPDAEGAVPRSFAPALLPACESAFALTIHKSQGSEFERVLVVMPTATSPLATRELLYTAITRSVTRVDLAGDAAMLEACVLRTQSRRSGLGDALWRT